MAQRLVGFTALPERQHQHRQSPRDRAWSWLRHDVYTFSSINVRRDGAIHDPPDRLAETREWMLDMLPQLRAVFDPRLAAILDGLRAPGSA